MLQVLHLPPSVLFIDIDEGLLKSELYLPRIGTMHIAQCTYVGLQQCVWDIDVSIFEFPELLYIVRRHGDPIHKIFGCILHIA